MPFRTLFDHGYAAYLDEVRDAGDLWFFLHIPKTAGSSFRAELAEVLAPNANVTAYDGSDDDFDLRRRRAVAGFAEAMEGRAFRFASGHMPYALLEPVVVRGAKLFTMLRDPVDRVISDYRYQTTQQHPDHAAFRERCPTIESYLDLPEERDKMLTFLAPFAEASVAETVTHLLDGFAFVGAMETYDASFGTMMDLLDLDRAASKFLRQSEAGEIVLTPGLDARIRAQHAGDVALYDSMMAYIREAARLRAEAGPVRRVAPETGFGPWRFV